MARSVHGEQLSFTRQSTSPCRSTGGLCLEPSSNCEMQVDSISSPLRRLRWSGVRLRRLERRVVPSGSVSAGRAGEGAAWARASSRSTRAAPRRRRFPTCVYRSSWRRTILFSRLLVEITDSDAFDRAYVKPTRQAWNRRSSRRARSLGPRERRRAAASPSPTSPRSSTYGSAPRWSLLQPGVDQSARGTDKVNAIFDVHLATGRIGRPGSARSR